MKCQNCFNEWNAQESLPESLIKCPKCGEAVFNEKQLPETILTHIVQSVGAGYLNDKIGSSYVLDALCVDSAEKKAIVRAVREGSIVRMLTAKEDTYDLVRMAVRQYFVEDTHYSEDIATYVIRAFEKALGWDSRDPDVVFLKGKDAFNQGCYDDAASLFKQAADLGSVDGQIMLGFCYEYGVGIDQDEDLAFEYYTQAECMDELCSHFEKVAYEFNFAYINETTKRCAVAWYSKAMACGSISAHKRLGAMYSQMGMVEEGLRLTQIAADQGDVEAMANLGVFYGFEDYKILDHEKSFYWLDKAIELGYIGAYKNKAIELFLLGHFDEAVEVFKEASLKGLPDAEHMIGFLYQKQKDSHNAFIWYKKAAEKGYVPSESIVGTYYLNGNAGTVDVKKGLSLIESAASKGYAEAIHNLAVLHERGIGVQQNIAYAFELYCDAAERGYFLSQYRVATAFAVEKKQDLITCAAEDILQWLLQGAKKGRKMCNSLAASMLFNGIGVDRDVETALELYKLGAEQGDVFAQTNLASYYYTGEQVPKDYAKAMYWYHKAADNNEPCALMRLGIMYAEGLNCKKDIDLGISYLKRALSVYKDGTTVDESDCSTEKKIYAKEVQEQMQIAQSYLNELLEEQKKNKGFFSKLFGK